LQDLDDIWRYIAQSSSKGASQFVEKLDEILHLLAEFPYMGRERTEWQKGLRSTTYQYYVIVYRVIEEGVLIERVVYGSRDIEGLFHDE
jgi:toxin ParE1/3/4